MIKRYRWLLLPIAFFVFYLAYINYTAQNVVYMDQIRMIPLLEKYYNGTLTPEDLWRSQSGQHRHLGYQVYFILNALLFNLNTKIDVNLTAMLLFLMIIIFSWNFSRTIGDIPTRRFILLHFPFVLVAFGLIKWETALIGLGLPEYYGLLVLAILVTATDLYLNDLINFPRILFALLTITTLAVAMSALLPFYLAMVFLGFYKLYNSDTSGYVEKRNNVLFVSAMILIQYSIYIYKINVGTYDNPFSLSENLLLIINHAWSATNFLFYAMSATVVGSETLTKLLPDKSILSLGVIVICLYATSLYVYFRRRFYIYTIVPGFMILGSLGYMGLILLGRFSFGESYGMQSRYSLSMMFGLLGIVWLWGMNLVHSGPALRYKIIAWSSITIIVLGFAITDMDEVRKAQYRKAAYEDMQRVISSQDEAKYDVLQVGPVVSGLNNVLDTLKRHNLNAFSGPTDVGLFDVKGDRYTDSWCGRSIEITGRIGASGEVTIKFYPPKPFVPNNLSIYDNSGALLRKITVGCAEEQTVVLKASPYTMQTFRIESEKVRIPKEVGLNQDARALSYLLLNVSSQ